MTFAEGAAGDRRDQTNGQQHHTLNRLRTLSFFYAFYAFVGDAPCYGEHLSTQLGVPVCYSAHLMMGNPGYIFFLNQK